MVEKLLEPNIDESCVLMYINSDSFSKDLKNYRTEGLLVPLFLHRSCLDR